MPETSDAETLRVLREMLNTGTMDVEYNDGVVVRITMRLAEQPRAAITDAIERIERLPKIEHERDTYKRYWDRFAEWAQEALDAGRWAGHPLHDAVRVELTEAREQLAGLRASVEAERTRTARALMDGAPRATTEAQVAAYDYVLALLKETSE